MQFSQLITKTAENKLQDHMICQSYNFEQSAHFQSVERFYVDYVYIVFAYEQKLIQNVICLYANIGPFNSI